MSDEIILKGIAVRRRNSFAEGDSILLDI